MLPFTNRLEPRPDLRLNRATRQLSIVYRGEAMTRHSLSHATYTIGVVTFIRIVADAVLGRRRTRALRSAIATLGLLALSLHPQVVLPVWHTATWSRVHLVHPLIREVLHRVFGGM